MANVAKMAHNLSSPKFPTPNAKSSASTSCSLFMGSNNLRNSSKRSWVLGKNSILTVRKTSQLRVVASVATTEKPSTVPEIVLQPIKEISGTVKLPGSKSLSNRILLLAALSEVVFTFVYCFVMLIKFNCLDAHFVIKGLFLDGIVLIYCGSRGYIAFSRCVRLFTQFMLIKWSKQRKCLNCSRDPNVKKIYKLRIIQQV